MLCIKEKSEVLETLSFTILQALSALIYHLLYEVSSFFPHSPLGTSLLHFIDLYGYISVRCVKILGNWVDLPQLQDLVPGSILSSHYSVHGVFLVL